MHYEQNNYLPTESAGTTQEPNFCAFCGMPVGEDSVCGSCLDDDEADSDAAFSRDRAYDLEGDDDE